MAFVRSYLDRTNLTNKRWVSLGLFHPTDRSYFTPVIARRGPPCNLLVGRVMSIYGFRKMVNPDASFDPT